jgi:hypothetical protein
VKAEGGEGAPALPLDSKITYEVRFDYPLQSQGGKPLGSPVVYKFNKNVFCPLLECPPPSKAQVGVEVVASFNEGEIAIQPEVKGEGKKDVDLEKLADFIGKSDRDREKWFEDQQIGPLKLVVNPILRQSVERFPGSQAQKKILELIDERAGYRKIINEFFAEKGWFSQPKNQKGEPIDDRLDRVGRWSQRCSAIVAQAAAAKDQEELRTAANDWKIDMVSKLDAWLKHHEQKLRDEMEKNFAAYTPLAGPVSLVISQLASPAYDQEGSRYEVILATPEKGTKTRFNKPSAGID